MLESYNIMQLYEISYVQYINSFGTGYSVKG